MSTDPNEDAVRDHVMDVVRAVEQLRMDYVTAGTHRYVTEHPARLALAASVLTDLAEWANTASTTPMVVKGPEYWRPAAVVLRLVRGQ